MHTDDLAQLQILLDQERTLQFDAFSHDDAWALGTRLRTTAAAQALPVAISIVLGDQRVFQVGLAGASADNDGWLERKFAVVRRYGHSSLAVGVKFRSRGVDFDVDARLDPTRFAAHGGAFPLFVRGSMVGVVGVSGLPQLDDHALVVEALRAQLAAA
ncbi:heme-degrading domain-containing protein [Cryobacterium sp. N21]|uniref:heme-degrading domain-containing protein n=1 Tax=Cryobacterium sp. N21 TaxID=2048289 RepID=UPI000CE3DE37|nr:heme-degrading domain-containing protein [Cryobacterium sp. N21]